MTLLADDPRALAASGTGDSALRWSLAAVTVAAAYAAAIWLAFALPDPEGAKGELQDAVMIELEPLTAIEEAPPPAPEPDVVEEAAADPTPAPIEEMAPEPPPPEPVVEEPPPPEPPPSEPVVEEPPTPDPVVPEPPPEPVIPEPVVEPPPPAPEPVEEPKPLPEPTTEEIVPDLIETDTIAAAVLNPPVPKLRPPPPRPVEKAERKPKVVEKPRRKVEPAKKPDRPKRVVERSPAPARSTAPRSETRESRRSAQAPRASMAAWKGKVNGHIRRYARTVNDRTKARGTATVSASIDASGRVISARISSSSGSPAFDAEAVALI